MNETTYLGIKWSISRGRDTYGYNIVTLVDTSTGRKYRCNGGGYDMVGTVFGKWLQDVHQDDLIGLDNERGPRCFYGMRMDSAPSTLGDGDHWITVTAHLDGAAGFSAMRAIAEAIGLTVTSANLDRNGNARGYLIERES